jgi:5-methyltetrahydrofolate--homocysteine methyltransferase
MIYARHLGYKGNFEKALAEHEEKALELFHNVEEVKREAARFMKVKAVWQFFEAGRDGNAIHLFAPSGVAPIHTFRFGRQRREDGLCLSDYILEGDLEGGNAKRDHLAVLVVTAGAGVRERSEDRKNAGAFFKAHAIQALAIETAEATAEWLGCTAASAKIGASPTRPP